MNSPAESKPRAAAKTPRVFSPATRKKREKALQDKRDRVMSAAITLFSQHGVNGTSVEQIAKLAKVSKTNLLYYFASKEQLYLDVINHLLQVWLTPLHAFSEEKNAIATLTHYIEYKLTLSRDKPAESKLFCMEVVQGAPLLLNELESPLCQLVENKVQVIKAWVAQGQLNETDPYHLLFSIWAVTQHYADFSVQVKAVTGKDLNDTDFFKQTLASITQILLGHITPA
ncbi:HTH-type transcriptional regulator RutR [Alteromonas lipolytica]|uniref:Pyrimidine utilization regulatory protein R n=1 Tax=Alteromonas lipolytica TaxID=1856405 RepID=A0A1E8F8M4_9ALTE|nr:HTH-type transcriptional regulator RutR [Alteromonas lipolytica]OFI32269.1 pyrimidine utilization regulatory protein R [Alteromonas lipolytica]GGF85912.1 pyrimidine utilization regulatory protein R [Alteromonas lipolytica]